MNNNAYKNPDELSHHGIIGMKWGVRRYQNKDGSLTSAGKKRQTLGDKIKEYRVNKTRKANLEKARKARAAKKEADAKRAKAIDADKVKSKDMTDAELQKRIKRLELERTYNDAVRNRKQNTLGKRFAAKFQESMVDKMADNVSADLLAQLTKSIGAKAINNATKGLFDGDAVYANNKKKG